MSTIRNLFKFMNTYSNSFVTKFDFYINSFDKVISYLKFRRSLIPFI